MSLSREQYDAIITTAANAPSGDNAQPWKFMVKEASQTIELYNIPGKDNSPYNFQERGSYFAHGALIENLALAASAYGHKMEVTLFPAELPHGVARIIFSADESLAKDPLADAIPLRRTNRKPYKKMFIPPDAQQKLADIANREGFGKLYFVNDKDKIKGLAKTLSLSDQLIFEDKAIHDAIFASIRWTKEDEEQRKGLYIMTLELPPPARGMFKLLNSWSALTILNHIGISKFIASQSKAVYSTAAVFGVLTIPNDQKESFVRAGRLFERIWLAATAAGIDIQPVTALSYLAQRIHANEPLDLSAAHQAQILAAEKNIRGAFGANDDTMAMIFRMGYGDIPSAQSQKSKPEIIYA